MGVHWNIQFLGGFTKKTIYSGDCLEGGAWAVCRFKRELGQKEGGW